MRLGNRLPGQWLVIVIWRIRGEATDTGATLANGKWMSQAPPFRLLVFSPFIPPNVVDLMLDWAFTLPFLSPGVPSESEALGSATIALIIRFARSVQTS